MNRRSSGLGTALVASSLMLAWPAAAQGARSVAAQPPPGETAAAPVPGAAQPGPTGAPGTAALTWNGQADTGVKPPEKKPAKKPPEKLKWRNTTFEWDQDTSAETIGIGQSYLSRDPYYDMQFTLRPRYYIYDDSAANVATIGSSVAATRATRTTISLRADIGALREFTNSDVTTQRGEWTMTDTDLYADLAHQLYKSGDFVTTIGVKLPTLTFPTSKFSMDSGQILGLGASVVVGQQLPVLGSKSDVLQALSLEVGAGYNHTFTEATTPTNSSLAYVRMNPEGIALPSDQLGGAPFAKHEAKFSVLADLQITDRIDWGNELSWRPQWDYSFSQTQVCGPVIDGCATPTGVNDPQHFTVVTLFQSELDVRVLDELGIGVGYANLTLQLAPDGTRRNIFYSPDARFYLAATAYLDEIYKTVSGARKSSEESAMRKGAPAAN